jgi:type II secretory pathway pseudopilin PulG
MDRAEEGFTLVEILISVWIMGAVMVALVGAIFTMSRGSDLARRTTIAETELRRVEEFVRNAPYEPCISTTTHYTDPYILATGGTAGSIAATVDGNVLIVLIQSLGFWDGAKLGPDRPDLRRTPQNHLPATCTTDNGIQVFTLTIGVGGSPTIVRSQVDFVKRDNQ